MKLEYEATLEDFTEPQVRLYLRSKSFSRQRYREPIWGGIGACIALYVISSVLATSFSPWWTYVMAFVFGYIVIYSTLKDTVSKRIQKYVKRELAHKIPSITTYDISDSQLRCSSLGTEVVFNLGSLSSVLEDTERMELVFGDVGLCTIPLRAFRNSLHKADFLHIIQTEQDGGGESAALRASP